MSRIPIQELRRMGVSREDIDAALTTQAAQRRNGSPVQSIGVIVGAVQQRPRHNPNPPVSLTDRAMRKRGTYDQAALLLDQQALAERSPERAVLARQAAKIAKELSAAQQLEFDFFGGGNVSIAFQYQDAVTERLRNSGQTLAKQHQALAVLWQITRHLGWQTYECTKTAADLCDLRASPRTTCPHPRPSGTGRRHSSGEAGAGEDHHRDTGRGIPRQRAQPRQGRREVQAGRDRRGPC